jgi:hypothetical protein
MILHYSMSGFPETAGQAVQLNPVFSSKGFEKPHNADYEG